MTRRGVLVGFGQVAEKAHAPAFRSVPGLELAAVVETRPDRRKAAAAALPGARLHASLEELLGDPRGLDFAVIATPPFLHARQSLAALEAGLSVLCEKPLGLPPEELGALRKAASSRGLALMTVHNWACSPQWAKALELAASGALGSLSRAELRVLRTKPAASAMPGDWRREASAAGGGILVDHGWHCLYLLRRLLPEEPQRAWLSRRPAGGGVEEEAAVLLEYAAATASLHLSWRAPMRSNSALLVGTEGTLELRDDELLLARGPGEPRRWGFPQALSAGSAHPDWLEAFLPAFAAALEDPARGEPNLDEAAFCLRTLGRLYGAPEPAAEAVLP